MKILLTGASGMMGRACALGLVDRGDDVTVLQRRKADVDCRQVLGDITDREAVRRAIDGAEVVLHMAAKVDAFGSWPDYERVNIDGTATVVEACLRAGVRALVNVSSPSVAHAGAALMGAGAGVADPSLARSHYSRSKAAAEQWAMRHDGPDLAVLSIRPHLVWGPGDTQLVARIIARARIGRLVFIGHGTPMVDTTYVDNAVDALIAAVDVVGAVHGEALVVSNGEPRPVGEILSRLCLAAGVPLPRRSLSLSAATVAGSVAETAWRIGHLRGEPPLTRFLAEQLGTAHWFDQRRSRELLKWSPAVSLDSGFEALRQSYLAG
ncbi:NAD-dependent epimerase/dehydratase family protein [Nakamurella antarctica]|uniref:NAD-dependent epimerase/dehydratase family protein n=1 Tax=Nakamurella antarctica TaxID=1902245 RepID=A0A3G8ZM79_9ACTN|nr:NAD-dependent epimerase/dehydratase family protein [Nakamurella antarctica]AZI57887.1 NAD-dependent epimerase/dehydratase family protein [Nakamurella antarctica]